MQGAITARVEPSFASVDGKGLINVVMWTDQLSLLVLGVAWAVQ